MNLPKASAYCGDNTLCVSMLGIDIYFSYSTMVAFRSEGSGLVVHENVWSKTTGKHLNAIDGGRKDKRVGSDVFEELWKKYVEVKGHK